MASSFSGRAGRLAGMWATDQALQDYATGNQLIDAAKTDTLGAIDRGRTGALASLGQGLSDATGTINGAVSRYDPWVDAGKSALSTYQNSLGLNGAGGNAAAVAAFQESPGYAYQRDQAVDAVARKQSALGALGSGNTMQAITDRSSQLANQEYGGWQDRLNGLSNTGLQATGQQTGLLGQLGNLQAQNGRDEAGVYTGAAGQEAGALQGYAGLGLNNLNQMSNTKIGAGSGALLAGQQAAQNRMNFGANLAKTAVSVLAAPFTGGLSLMGLAAPTKGS
ncbi:hypothetical protein LJR009_006055 [Bosea sp. LjRoot9]|uniref:hypothetical protein n=1 Tax=Bosea sp. LjRoot9 TaxID=3342341 RepID=UPI003ECEDF9E